MEVLSIWNQFSDMEVFRNGLSQTHSEILEHDSVLLWKFLLTWGFTITEKIRCGGSPILAFLLSVLYIAESATR